MFRALLVLAALASPAPFLLPAFHDSPDPETHPHHDPRDAREPVTELVIDGAHVPADRGWFVVPVTAAAATFVDVDARVKMSSDDDGALGEMLILAFPDDGRGPFSHASAFAPVELVEANRDGETFGCCHAQGLATSSASGESGTGAGGQLGAGETIWVGLAAVGWTHGEDRLEITIRSYDAPVTQGEVRSGKDVEVVDLVAAAHREGDNVRVLDQTVAGEPGDLVREWNAKHTGLFQLSWHVEGDGVDGHLRVEVPGEESFSHGLGWTVGHVAAARHGAFTVALTDLETPERAWLQHEEDYSWLRVRAMFADVDIPADAAWVWHEHLEREEDW